MNTLPRHFNIKEVNKKLNIFDGHNQLNSKEKNIFFARIKAVDRKSRTEFEKYVSSLDFNGCFHSNCIEEYKFTNFLKSYSNEYCNVLFQIFDEIFHNRVLITDYFYLDETDYSKKIKGNERLRNIIAIANNIDIKNVPEIKELIPIKLLKEDKRFETIRLFVNFSEKTGTITLFLIDLYHFGINAIDYKTHKRQLDEYFEKNKNYNKCISKVFDMILGE